MYNNIIIMSLGKVFKDNSRINAISLLSHVYQTNIGKILVNIDKIDIFPV